MTAESTAAATSLSPAQAFADLSALLAEEMELLHVPGAALGVLAGGQEHVACFGITSVDNPLPVTEDTLFQIGSTTKTITATVAMRLVEDGKLDLDAPVRRYLPELRLQDEGVAERVTIRNLFTHTGGWSGDFFEDTGWGDDALARFVEKMANLKQETPLGAFFSYNNAGFSLAGRVIEAVTGKTYEAAAKELLFEPAGLTHSIFSPVEVLLTRYVAGHMVRDGVPQVSRPWPTPRSVFPAGGVAASIRDQLAYARIHLEGGVAPNGARILQESTVAAMREPQCQGDMDCWRGIAWNLEERTGVKLAFHGGSTNGQQSAFMTAPEQGFAVAVLTNADRGARLHRLVVERALEAFLGVPPRRPQPIEAGETTLLEYVGDYPLSTGIMRISIKDGGLFMDSVPDPNGARLSEAPQRPTSTRMVLTAPDRILCLDAPYEDVEAEFLRDDAGRVAYSRFGLRLRPRVPAPPQ